MEYFRLSIVYSNDIFNLMGVLSVKKIVLISVCLAFTQVMADSHENGKYKQVSATANNIAFPADYADWNVISVSHRIDNKTMRLIVGNDVAIKAARNGNTLPWPDGAILGKIVWKEKTEADWPTAIAPNKFVHAEFMFKDSKKWSGNTTGWGWARWVGENAEPFGKDALSAEQSCIACHTLVKGKDWVFTTPAKFPTVMK